MKRKLKNALLLVLLGVFALAIFAGCKLHHTREDYLKEFDLTATVTYYTDEVTFDDGTKKTELNYQTNSPALNIGVIPATGSISTQFSALEATKFKFNGWYFIELDENGNPVFEDEAKTIYKLTNEKVDFTKKLAEGEHWYVGAKWSPLVGLKIIMCCDDGATVNGKFDNEQVAYKNGDAMFNVQFPSTGKLSQTELKAANKLTLPEGSYTFVNYYIDKECTQAFSEMQKTEEDVIVYAKYLTGAWEIVTNRSEVADIFKDTSAGKRYWIEKDIDCSKYTLTITAPETFACEIQSNGKTIKGLTLKRVDANTMTTGHKASLFGNITATAKIINVNFKDVKLECTVKSSPVEIYLAFTSLAEGAQVENVTVSGTLNIRMTNQTVTNLILNEGETEYKNVAFGGYDTDAAYVAANPNGITVEGKSTDIVKISK